MTSKENESGITRSAALGHRVALLEAYKLEHRERRERKKNQHKVVILANARRRHPRAIVKQNAPTKDLLAAQNHSTTSTTSTSNGQHEHHRTSTAPTSAHSSPIHHSTKRQDERAGKMNYLKKFMHHHGLKRGAARPDGWAAAKVNRAMHRLYMLQLMSSNRLPKYLYAQSKKLFEECCKCRPLASGPTVSEADGILQLAGPNLPKILRVLRSSTNTGLDLLQPHGIAQYTVMHVAAQRGYLELTRELMSHWDTHPMESPHQSYSIQLLHRLLELLLQLRRVKALVSESHSDLRDVVAKIGVPFAYFSEELDKLHDDAITLQDLLRICGHPLVLCRDASGNTPLHYAAEGGYLSLCKLLLDNGAHINAQNKSGETPLHFAISSSHQDVCSYFVRNKADVRICRYVGLTLLNNVTIFGTFVDAPPDNAVCKVMPILQPRSTGVAGAGGSRTRSGGATHGGTWLSRFVSPASAGSRGGVLRRPNAVISPEIPLSPRSKELGAAAHASGEPQRSSSPAGDGMYTRVESLASSPLFRDRSPREVVFFRTAPGSSLIKPNVLCVLLVGDHVAVSEMTRSRESHDRGKLFHLLIQNLPEVAVVAMDSFRTPLFRCSMAKSVREFHQRWVVDSRLQSVREKHSALLLLMKGARVPNALIVKRRKQRRREAEVWLLNATWRGIKKVYKTLRRVRNAISVQHVFAAAESDSATRDSIICEPKGILYEYEYDHSEFRGGWSPTLELVIETENKELMEHPWTKQLLDHKWHSFASQTFRSEFHLYAVYFIAVFVATYLHVGDTFVGMPIGGYRSSAFTTHVLWTEYLRDAARVVYSVINAFYTYDEIRSCRELGSVRAYLRDGWNWFDMVLIACVWMLLATEVLGMLDPSSANDPDFELVVFQTALYSTAAWRRYNLRTTLMSIVGPQVFIRWIRFARGNLTLGPFVRMIFKMFKDIALFLLVFGLFLFGFAFAFFILQIDACLSYFDAVLTVLKISLGEWDWDAIYEGGPIAITFFIAYVVLGTIMLLNLLIAMLGNTYDKIWEDRLLFFELERAKATISIQTALNDTVYDERYWCQQLYVLEGDRPIEGIQFQKF